MNLLVFLLVTGVFAAPGIALMKKGDERFAEVNAIWGYEERQKRALPYYISGGIWLAIIFAVWIAGSLHFMVTG